MATFSREFLSNLGNPAMGKSMFGLGAAIGGIPGQITAKKKAEADKATAAKTTQGVMSAIKEQDPAKLEAVAEQLRLAGQPAKAMQVFQQAQVLKEKIKLEKEKQTLERGERSLVNFATAAGMDLNDPKAKEFFFRRANIYGVDPTRASELFDQFVTDKKGTSIVSAGATLVDEDGNVIFKGAFKPTEPKAPVYKVTSATKLDPNIRVFRDGVQTEVIPVSAGDSEADAAARLAGISKLVGIKQTITTLLGPEYQASGILGAIAAKWIPGTDARDRDRLIQSLRSNLGLEAIADLKALSSTGSTGLGQVSNIELNALQSAVDSIDVSMSEKAQIRALTKIFEHIDRAQKAMAGVLPKDTIEWNSPTYNAAGFNKSEKSGEIYYSPTGPDGQIYRMNTAGMFVPI
jgi:hypothetical protein